MNPEEVRIFAKICFHIGWVGATGSLVDIDKGLRKLKGNGFVTLWAPLAEPWPMRREVRTWAATTVNEVAHIAF